MSSKNLERHQRDCHTLLESQCASNGTTKHYQASTDSTPKSSSCHYSPEINPFVHRLHFSKRHKIQNFIMAVTILPIRGLVAFSCLVVSWLFAFIALLGRSKDDAQQPLTGWRNCLRPVVVFWARCMFFFGGFHWVTVRGQRASSQEAPILVVAPHSSYFDALPITYLGLSSVVAKTSAQQVPFFGTLTKFTQPVFVSREDPNSRSNTIVEIRRRAATGGKWPQILIFPEGTCTNRSCVISFKPGAFIPGVAVQPVCIKYPVRHDTITWTWCGIGALKALYYTLCQFNSPCEIEFLPVYTPSEAEKNDAMLFARNVRAKMAKALGVPITEHSYEDGEAMLRAAELSLPPSTRLVNINMLLRQAGVALNESELDGFAKVMHESKTFLYSRSQVASCLSPVISRDTSDQLFTCYDMKRPSSSDVDGENLIDMRQCVMDLYLVSRPTSIHKVLHFAFRVYSSSDRSSLSNEELCDMMTALCHYDVTTNGKPPGHSFTYDDVLEFASGINDGIAESLKKADLPSDSSKKCDACEKERGRVKVE